MAKRTVFTCNICGKDKQATNHWWIVYMSGGIGLMISPWNDALADNEQVNTLCGQECVIKAVSAYLSA